MLDRLAESIREFMSDDIFDGLSFFLAVLTLTAPYALKKFRHTSRVELINLFWWLASPLLAVFTALSAYREHFEMVCLFGGISILLHFIRQREQISLENKLEDTEGQLDELKRRFDQYLRSGQRNDPIIRP